MSNPSERPWTEEEKTFLLTEILKRAAIPPYYLYALIVDHRISPAYAEIPLPPGRPLISCQNAFTRMGQEFSISQHRQSLPAPGVPLQISPGDRKRPLPALQLENKAPRPIQPKPPIPGQYPIQESRTPVQLSPGVDANFFGEPPRKRGRPSKAEMQRRSLAAQARGEPYPPPKKAPPRPQVDLSPIGPSLESSTLPAIRPQVSGSPVHGLSMQQPDAAGSQTHDIQVHRAPRPQIPASPPIPPSAEPRESTPRTILENQVPPPPTSSAPSFRGVNQTSSVPASPRPETPLISSSAAVENGREPTQAFSGSAKGATS